MPLVYEPVYLSIGHGGYPACLHRGKDISDHYHLMAEMEGGAPVL